MKLVVTDTFYRNTGFLKRFKLDMAFGSDENDFTLTVPCRTKIPIGSLVYIPGTEWGGLVREPWVIREEGLTYRVYHGQTWHGLMAERVLYPDAGVDHLTASGDVSAVIQSLVERVGLQGIFQAAPSTGLTVPSFKFDHDSTYLYGGLMKMLESIGCILDIRRYASGKTLIGAMPTPMYVDDSRTSKMGLTAKRLHPINHLVCLGKGELKERIRVDLYADRKGNISQTQSIFGTDVREEIYDLPMSERDDLIESGIKYLKDKQVFTEAKIEMPDGISYPIGSIVNRKEARGGVEITARLGKVVVKLYSTGDREVTGTLTDETLIWKDE